MRTYGTTSRRRHEPAIDGLPEHQHYRDTGCEASPSCLDCPLPQCKFDNPAWYQKYRKRGRDEQICEAYTQGLTIFEVAHRFDVSTRTIHRALARLRQPTAAAA